MRKTLVLLVMLAACGDDGAKKGDVATTIADTSVADVTPDVATEVTPDVAPDVATEVAPTEVTPTEVVEDSVVPSDTTEADSAPSDSTTSDTSEPVDGASETVTKSCTEEGHAVGERYPVGDHCNFCDCQADGTAVCTTRTCKSDLGGCSYGGRDREYAARFPATDGCNECVCAASGLACTHRCAELEQEGAILLESMTDACGDDPEFTGEAVLKGLPYNDFTAPFTYDTERDFYPETLGPTTVRIRIVYEMGGYIVCRIPSPEQPAIDMEVTVEWMTADDAFNEGFHTYLRRNNFGFVDGWYLAHGAGDDDLDGQYDSVCLDPNGYSFGATIYADESADGSVGRVCETDILLTVGSFAVPIP